jgi:hypothetical protein
MSKQILSCKKQKKYDRLNVLLQLRGWGVQSLLNVIRSSWDAHLKNSQQFSN